MSQSILTVNVGSSSIKTALFHSDDGNALRRIGGASVSGLPDRPHLTVKDAAGTVTTDRALAAPAAGRDPQDAALDPLMDWLDRVTADAPLAAIGHRVVHGGPDFAEPVRVDDRVLDRLAAFVPLAPLHQPHNLAAIRAFRARVADVPHIACFDTAFHQGKPWRAKTFPLPPAYFARNIRRYGFHGLSYDYIARTLPEVAGHLPRRTVAAHLGNGASLCALLDGRSVATSMGLTALDGLPMGTRTGAIDPGLVLYLIQDEGMSPDAVADLLYHHGGLKGMSGLSNDMTVLRASDDPQVVRTLDYYAYRVAQGIAALAVDLGGLDAVVFTAGIGQNDPGVRAGVARHLAWMGTELDDAANDAGGPCLHTPDSRVGLWAIATDEAGMIARHTLAQARR
ncbi:hypothetical protein CCR85_04255 [Rhodothalassium salexigens]|uniref:acetate/propionate family kinase n=1 Tax=Rhodothalassium salexigens TaxID=1086 RepID=UPI001913FB5E|nr:acetate/propionate family kinase [Rhodothalassium salexigens]MBK5910704.1 hypothetical protein [Rhodothalassium salexigens]MBK5921666.1 hypothetical protein [Rhodothalassium salexigens]